jgi:hypothetical protein
MDRNLFVRLGGRVFNYPTVDGHLRQDDGARPEAFVHCPRRRYRVQSRRRFVCVPLLVKGKKAGALKTGTENQEVGTGRRRRSSASISRRRVVLDESPSDRWARMTAAGKVPPLYLPLRPKLCPQQDDHHPERTALLWHVHLLTSFAL